MIAAFDPDQSRIFSDSLHNLFQQAAAGEGVPGAADEQHRSFQCVQVFVAELIGLSGRMKRIAEKHQAIDAGRIAGNVRRNSSTHRFSADDQPGWFVPGNDTLDHSAVPRLKFRLWIRHGPFRVHVVEIEPDRQKTAVREFGMEMSHERREHSLPGAMSKDNRGGAGRGLGFENVE